ncbi:MAG: hypothetical protein JXA74_06190 [Anaerolineae bacterium]|nr:hypothetical protein [Anaerolineae bacterium]
MHQPPAPGLDAPAARVLLARHRAFWRRTAAEHPLIQCSTRRTSLPESDEAFERLTPRAFLAGLPAALDDLERRTAASSVLDGDLFRCLELPGQPPWMIAILGCPVYVARRSGVQRWGRLPGGWEQLQSLDPDVGGVWRGALRQGVSQLVALCGRDAARLPIATFHGRGPVDLLAQALGDEALALRVADDPASLSPVLEKLTALWIDLAREVLALVPPTAGGYLHRYGLWAPGTLAAIAVDAAGLLSPRSYAELFLPHDRRICAAFDHLLVHSHSGALTHARLWGNLPGAAIQIVEDAGDAAAWPALLDVARDLQARGHPLLLSLAEPHLASAQAELDPRGLALVTVG